MTIHHEHINRNPDSTFLYRWFRVPAFDGIYHNHPEFELTLILKSSGQRCIGNQIATFQEGELVLLGPDIPHYWRNNAGTRERKKTLGAESIVIQFDKGLLTDHFSKLPEFEKIAKLLDRSRVGLLFNAAVSQECAVMIQEMEQFNPFDRLICLMQLLQKLSMAKNTRMLTKPIAAQPNYSDIERINKVYQYVDTNFRGTISLKEAAEKVNMAPASFCRYFKKITKRTLFDIVGEYRIYHACHLLLHTEMSIADICFACGYSIPAHFNDQFKKRLRVTPLKYRITCREEV